MQIQESARLLGATKLFFDKIVLVNYLPSKLNKLRKHYSYSQQYVADFLDVDVIKYMNFENGSDMISYSQMKKLSYLYNISVSSIFKNNDDIDLPDIKLDTNEINVKYFTQKNGIKNKIKGFVINHKIVSGIILVLLIAIVVLSIILKNAVRPYTIEMENINRLSASETTVIYIEDSGMIGFSGSNSNGQLSDLVVSDATKVCEGGNFSIVLSKDGKVASSGLITKYAEMVKEWENIVDIAAGDNHVVAVDSNGRVYCAGEGEACNIEGTRNVKKVYASASASIVQNDSGTLSYSGSVIGSSYLKDFMNIKDIASSENILAILNNDGTLNVYSKSGSFLKSETWKDIVDVTCGDDFVAGLNSFGKVFIEIDNDKYIEEVNEWSNIIAIASGNDYLVGFDGKNIYGIGKNTYNQFIAEEKKKITLETVNNIEYNIKQNEIDIQFDGIKNADGYRVEINVGTGLEKYIETPQTVSFTTENMIEGKTYSISITSVGSGDYKDSDVASKTFVYNKPEKKISINVSDYIGKNKKELDKYLTENDITYKSEVDSTIPCTLYEETVESIEGIEDGEYNESELATKIVKYTYCKVKYDE